MTTSTTLGVHHVGLTVPDLDAAVAFFADALDFQIVGEKPAYPAKFVSDGSILLTLWQAKADAPTVGFDRFHHIGLHHLALAVPSLEALLQLHDRIAARNDAEIEFAPEPLGDGPATHMMLAGPGGIRLELIHRPA